MLLWILLLLLIQVLFGFGFTMQILWYVAALLLVVWIAGFAMRCRGRAGADTAEAAGSPYQAPPRPRDGELHGNHSRDPSPTQWTNKGQS